MPLRYLWPALGHPKQLAQLERDLGQGRLGHAYLFSGPSKIGKTLVARTFAQILQCPNDLCRSCPTCLQVEKGQHIDTIELSDNGESMKIEAVRELLSHLATTPSARYKIFLIQNIERFTPEATNAFLKSLEEPISNVIFLLTTCQPKQLLDTLVSRVRMISFNPISEAALAQLLKERRPDMPPHTLEQMASFALGRPGRAFDFIESNDTFRQTQEMYQQLLSLLQNSSLNDRFVWAEELIKEPASLEMFLELFAQLVRRFLLEKAEGGQIPYSYDQLFGMVDALHQAQFDLEHNVNTRLVLEHLMLTF